MSEELIGGRYQLERELRRTSRVTGYAATEVQSALPVTIKLLRPDLLAEPHYRAELLSRLNRLKSLAAPTPALTDLDLDAPRPYLVERVIVGQSVGDRLRAGETFTPAQLTELAQGALEALAALGVGGFGPLGHLTPDSVLWASDGTVSLVDLEQPLQPIETAYEARYQAPEVLAGAPADVTADLHALSCVLYHAALGRPPFDGPTAVALGALKQTQEAEPIGNWRADLPASWVATVTAGLQRSPAHRPPNALAYAALMRGGPNALGAGAPLGLALSSQDPATPMPIEHTTLMAATDAEPVRPTPAPAHAPRPEPRADAPRARWAPWLAILAVALILGALAWALSTQRAGPRAPQLMGLSLDAAKAKLHEVELRSGEVTSEWSDTIARGMVVRQTPEAGVRVPAEVLVDLVLSKGPEKTVVPDLTGMDLAGVKAALAAADLRLSGPETAQQPGQPDGVAIYQNVTAGTSVARGTKVHVVINKRPPVPAPTEPTPTEPTEPPAEPAADAPQTVDDVAGSVVGEVVDQVMEKTAEKGRELTKKGIEAAKDWSREKLDEFKNRDAKPAPKAAEGPEAP